MGPRREREWGLRQTNPDAAGCRPPEFKSPLGHHIDEPLTCRTRSGARSVPHPLVIMKVLARTCVEEPS
jgi:hypothetical protein